MVTLIVICSNCEWDVGNRTQLRNVFGISLSILEMTSGVSSDPVFGA